MEVHTEGMADRKIYIVSKKLKDIKRKCRLIKRRMQAVLEYLKERM